MPIEVSRIIDAPSERVWDLMVRVSEWRHWGPSVTAVRCSDDEIGPGSSGMIRTPPGIWLPFLVTDFDPGRSWRWRVGGIPATGHRVDPLGHHRSRVVFEIPWWAPFYVPVCRRAAARIAQICAESPVHPDRSVTPYEDARGGPL